jgi:phage-related protein
MAVVGSARIIVSAITTGVGPAITKAMRSAERSADADGERIGSRLGDSINRGLDKGNARSNFLSKIFDINQAEGTRQAWVSLQKTGFNLQTGAGALAGSLGALVGTLGAVAGAAGGASAALVAVGGAALGLGVGAKLAGLALGGVGGAFSKATKPAAGLRKSIKEIREEFQQLLFDAESASIGEEEAALNLEKARNNLARMADLPPNSTARREAELELKKADLAYRKAVDRTQDLNEKVAEGPEGLQKAASGGGSDPYAGLTKSQADFAKQLVALKPKFDILKEAVAKGFLPELGKQIDKLFGENFPTLENGFTRIGVALGTSTKTVGDFINSAEGMKGVNNVFGISETVMTTLGNVVKNLFGSLFTVLDAATPLIEKFVSFVDTKLQTFNDFLSGKNAATGEGSSQLRNFFNRAGELAAKFGKIFGNVFAGFGKIIEANFGPNTGGDNVLNWLITATDKFANLDKTVGGMGALKQFFVDSAANGMAMFKSIGALISELIQLGSMPQIKEFWDTLAGGAPALGSILEEGIKAGPILAQLIVDLTKIAAVFMDSGAIQTYFGVLQTVTGKISELLQNETVVAIIDTISKIGAFFLALGTLAGAASRVGQIIFATFARFGPVFGPVLFIVAAIAGAFIYLYNTSSEAKTQIDAMLGALMDAGGQIMSTLSAAMAELAPVLMEVMTALLDVVMSLLPVIVDSLIPAFIAITEAIVPIIGIVVSQFLPIFVKIIEAITPLIPIIIDMLVPIILQIAAAIERVLPIILNLVSNLLTALMPAFIMIFNAIMPVVQALIELMIPIIEMLITALAPIITVVTVIVGVFANLVAMFLQFLMPVLTVIIKIVTFVAQLFAVTFSAAITGFTTIFRGAFEGISTFFKFIMNGMIGFAEGFINFFIDGINGMVDLINSIQFKVPDWVPAIGGQTIGANLQKLAKVRLARLADGGTVFPSAGGSIVNVAEAGRPERIEPLDPDGLSRRDKAIISQLSGGGMNITVNAGPGMDEKELAAAVSRQLAFEMRKGTI